MKAILAKVNAPDPFVFSEVAEPRAGLGEVLVRVAAVSLNRGEVRRATQAQSQYIPGWDLAGVVEEPAMDGSSPKAGTRVVGILPVGSWAEKVAVPAASLAAIPDSVSFSQAATLPVAGLTALYILQRVRNLVGQRVLVTGASGGAGNFAVQLARLSGAEVVGITHHPGYADTVREAGAWQVVVNDPEAAGRFGPYHLIADSVGGPLLSSIFGYLAPGGSCINYGTTAGPEITLNLRSFFAAPRSSLSGFLIFDELKTVDASIGLAQLANLVAAGRLKPPVSVEASWSNVSAVTRRLMDREFPGKAVLLVD